MVNYQARQTRSASTHTRSQEGNEELERGKMNEDSNGKTTQRPSGSHPRVALPRHLARDLAITPRNAGWSMFLHGTEGSNRQGNPVHMSTAFFCFVLFCFFCFVFFEEKVFTGQGHAETNLD
jgi:hypothetical protein